MTNYRALGYHCNPFKVLTPDEWVEVALLPPPIVEALEHDHHLLVMGKRGRGKSTALRTLAAYYEDQGLDTIYEYIPPGQHHFETEHVPDVFCLDEAQRLWPHELLRLASMVRGSTRLIIGSHLDVRPAFWLTLQSIRVVRLRGYAVSDPLSHLRNIINRRLDYFALGDGPRTTLDDEAVTWLYNRFDDDLREVEWHLFHMFQSMERMEAITSTHLAQLAVSAARHVERSR